MFVFRSLKLPAYILVFLIGHLSLANLATANSNSAYIAGKVFDKHHAKALVGVVIRIVNVETGTPAETKSKEDGCFSFRDVTNGTYSVSVNHKGADYLLPEKITVQRRGDREVAVAVCMGLAESNRLALIENCQICMGGGGFPSVKALVIGGAAAVVAGIIAIGNEGGGTVIVSPFKP